MADETFGTEKSNAPPKQQKWAWDFAQHVLAQLPIVGPVIQKAAQDVKESRDQVEGKKRD